MTSSRADTLQAAVQALAQLGERTAVLQMRETGTERWSYAEVAECAGRLAAGLAQEGLRPGERVVLFAPNSPEWIVACLALLQAGIVPVPVDAQAGREDLLHIIADSGADWVFTTASGAQRLSSGDRPRLLLLDQAGERGGFWRDVLGEPTRGHAPVSPRDCALLFYTSGTTGPPKGVPLTHVNLLSNLEAVMAQNLVRSADRLLLPLPLHHVYPFVLGLLTPLSLGMTLILPRSLVGQHFLGALNEGRATVLLGVPRLYSALLAAIEQGIAVKGGLALRSFRGMLRTSIALRSATGLDAGKWLFTTLRRKLAPRLRLLVSGGSALDPDVAWKLEGLGWRVASGYGLTETSPILTFNAPGTGRLDSAGLPLPGVQIRLAEPQPPFRHGEVLAKGANVFSGYRNLPERTRETFTEDGWFRTGDLGYLDPGGFLHLDGRTSSMIVLQGGENVDPEKLEARLEQSPSIREAGVLEDEGRLLGVLLPEPALARERDPEELLRELRAEVQRISAALPTYQRLGEIVVDTQPLPRTRLGKLQRHRLVARCKALKQGSLPSAEPGLEAASRLSPEDRQLLEDPVASRLWIWLGERFAAHRVTPDTDLRVDLGVDSLEWLNLTLEIRNRVGVELTDQAVARIQTVRDLLREGATAQRALGWQGDVLALLREPEALLSDAELAWLEPRPFASQILDPLVAALAALLMRLVFRFRAEGLEQLPGTGPYVLTPNHCSALDPIAVAAALGRRRLARTYWGGWVGILFSGPLRSRLSHAVRVLPVAPDAHPLSNLALASAALGRGYQLVWFPEGARSPTGETQRFRAGIGLLLRAHPVPAVPVWIEGAGAALPPGTLWPRRRAVSLRCGEPSTAEQLEPEGSGDCEEERIADALRSRVAALGRRGIPPRRGA